MGLREGAGEPWREEGQNTGPEAEGAECQWSKGIKARDKEGNRRWQEVLDMGEGSRCTFQLS